MCHFRELIGNGGALTEQPNEVGSTTSFVHGAAEEEPNHRGATPASRSAIDLADPCIEIRVGSKFGDSH